MQALTLKEFKDNLALTGLSVKTRKNSDFISAKVFKPNGEQLNAGNIFTKKDLEDYAEFFSMKKDKIRVVDGAFTVVY